MTGFQPAYLLPVGLAVALALCYPVSSHLPNRARKRDYYRLQIITLIGAVLGAKLSMLFGDIGWPWRPVNDWTAVLWSGRSITGALIGGFLFAEVAKPLVKYPLPPNDRFAALLMFSIAIGRIGCLLAGCCPGTPHDGLFSIRDAEGVARHPAQVYEIAFHLALAAVFVNLVRRGVLFGRLFSLYLVLYGLFRFFTEYIRATPKLFLGWSGYQWLTLVMIGLGTAFLIHRSRHQPAGWNDFKPQPQTVIP